MELKERIKSYLSLEDRHEVITQIEDELEDIVTRIYDREKYDSQKSMDANATLIRKLEYGYLAKTDDGETVYIPNYCYKGESEERGTRLQCGQFRERNGKMVSRDAMESLDYGELRYRLFSYIEEHNMVRAATIAWAIYKDAQEDDREEMKFCIHTLRNYLKKSA
jgi:hypothetical protein